MDKHITYRASIRQLLQKLATYTFPTNAIERAMILDEQHDHYQLMNIGWQGEHRIYECVLHISMKNGKVWIQYNATEVDVAETLMSSGVAREDIVLGFQSPYRRQYTGFAIG